MENTVAGRTFFITGANSGIGRAAAEALAKNGANLVLAGRSEPKLQEVHGAISREHPSAKLELCVLDLASLKQVKRAAEQFLARGTKVDVLVNNAGIAGSKGRTPDGYEMTVGTNHLGHFLLTELLLPRLKESAQGRIVNVSSDAHRAVKKLDLTIYRDEAKGPRERLQRYGESKLMNILHAKELARRLKGTRVTTYALHPGVVATNVWRSLPWPARPLVKLFMLSDEEGAKTTVHCATSPHLATSSGFYYEKCAERRPSSLAEDVHLAEELWTWSEVAVETALTS